MPKNGESCTTSGTYSGTCSNGHSETGHFQVGDVFTPCTTGICGGQGGKPSRNGSPMTWTLVRAAK